MSKALKCDRCGKCFDPDTDEAFLSINELAYFDGESCKRHQVLSRQWQVDMCPLCTEKFRLFMSAFDPIANITDPLVKDGVQT